MKILNFNPYNYHLHCKILFVFLAGLTFSNCKKDFSSNLPPFDKHASKSGRITIDEAQSLFKNNTSASSERSYQVSIQDITPIWEASVNALYAGQSEILIVPVEPDHNRLPGGGANLIFYRGLDTLLNYCMLVHIPNPTYWDSTHHNLNTQTYTGAILQVNSKGKIGEALFFDGGTFMGTDGGAVVAMVGDIDCDNIPDCPQWGDSFWDNVGNFFSDLWHSWDGLIGGINNAGSNGSSTQSGFINTSSGVTGFGGINNSNGNNTPNVTGGGNTSWSITNYFDPTLFEGIERKNAQMINQFKENYGISTPALALLENIKTLCNFSNDPNELFFELKAVLLTGIAGMPECLRNVINNDRILFFQETYGLTVTTTQLVNMNMLGLNTNSGTFIASLLSNHPTPTQAGIFLQNIQNITQALQTGNLTLTAAQQLLTLADNLGLTVEHVNWFIGGNLPAISTINQIIAGSDTSCIQPIKEVINYCISNNQSSSAFVFAFTEVLTVSGEIIDLNMLLDCFVISGNENYINKVTLNVDQPIPGSTAAYSQDASGAVDVGHTFITIEQVSPDGEVHSLSFGFYPSGGVRPKLNPSAQGAFVHDELHHSDVNMSWNLTASNFTSLINNAKNVSQTTGIYHLDSNNCSSFASNLLNSIGLGIPQNSGSWPGGGGVNPGRLGEDLRTMQLQPWMSRNAGTNTSPESVNCH
jgi:hypothetical protein